MPIIAGFRQAGVSARGADHRQDRPPRHIRQTRHDGLLENEGGRARQPLTSIHMSSLFG